MGKSVKHRPIIFTQIECLSWQKRKAEQLENNIWFKLDYYANNHIICIIYAKFEKYLITTVFVRKIMSHIVEMFPRVSRNNISIKKLDIYANIHHKICKYIQYQEIRSIYQLNIVLLG